MPYSPSFGTIQNTGEPIEAPKPESPFRIGMLADFGGRQNRGEIGTSEEIAGRRLVRVARDTLDDVMAKMGVQLDIPVGDAGKTASLSFASLDDFHPDQVHDRVDDIADAFDADEKSELMNSVIHHADFQALESAWRGLDWLLGRAAKGGQVEVFLLDISLSELAADLKNSDDLTESAVHKILIEKGVRGTRGAPWAMLIGDYTFETTGAHAETLGRMAKVASQSNTPFLTTINPEVIDKSFTMGDEDAPAWQELRALPEAEHLGLAVPRFLLRLPYGENTKSIDKFDFNEMPKPPDAGGYLWGNPALLCAALLVQAFQKKSWDFRPGDILELDNLPVHVYTVDGDEEVTLAQAALNRILNEHLLKQGIMALLCIKGKAAMQLARFLSLAQPPKNQPAVDLRGRWSGLPAPRSEEPPPKAAPPPAAPAAKAAPPPPPPAPPPAEEAPAAEEEMDPDLAALLKQLEEGS